MIEQLPSSRADQLIPVCLQEPRGGPKNEETMPDRRPQLFFNDNTIDY